MKAYFNVVDPDEVEMELTVRMPLKEWKELKSQLSAEWPSWKLGSDITDMVLQAECHFNPKDQLW